jgi:hypothetical protein
MVIPKPGKDVETHLKAYDTISRLCWVRNVIRHLVAELLSGEGE